MCLWSLKDAWGNQSLRWSSWKVQMWTHTCGVIVNVLLCSPSVEPVCRWTVPFCFCWNSSMGNDSRFSSLLTWAVHVCLCLCLCVIVCVFVCVFSHWSLSDVLDLRLQQLVLSGPGPTICTLTCDVQMWTAVIVLPHHQRAVSDHTNFLIGSIKSRNLKRVSSFLTDKLFFQLLLNGFLFVCFPSAAVGDWVTWSLEEQPGPFTYHYIE